MEIISLYSSEIPTGIFKALYDGEIVTMHRLPKMDNFYPAPITIEE